MTNTDDARFRERILRAPPSTRLLVEAGPGTGKTEMAAARISSLIRNGLSPGQLLVLSFSRSAVRNLTQRLARIAGTDDRILEELRHVSIRTFDSWAFRILRLLGHPAPKLLAKGHDENISALTDSIDGTNRDGVRELMGNRRHLIVDEFQDLPGVRGELVLALLKLIAPPGQFDAGFTVLGDPAQAIYDFAAGDAGQGFLTPAQYWNRITESYGSELEVISLTQNYRANRPLAELSASLRRVLLSQNTESQKLELVQKVIADLPPPKDPVGPSWLNNSDSRSRAILTRTNGESLRVLQRLFGKAVEGGSTPVRLRAGNYASLPPAWVAGLLSQLKSSQLLESQFGRIYTKLTQTWDDVICRGLDLPTEAAAWSRLCWASGAPEGARSFQLTDLCSRLNWPDAFPDDQVAGEDGLVITTIHQSKGLEFDIVTVLDTPRNDPLSEDLDDGPHAPSVLEEARVHYVAVTRAGHQLNRQDRKGIYQPPRKRTLQKDRERLCHWKMGWINLEMGLRGDIDPLGFVDPGLHGGNDAVKECQDFLLRNAFSLQGHKVMLRKFSSNGKALWHIHLQETDGPTRLIGRTAPQLTHDLLDMLYNKGFKLPNTILNLRIADVGTISSVTEFQLAEPYRTSGLWLGVSLFGTGDFKTYKRKR